MTRQPAIYIILLLLTSCFRKAKFDESGRIESLGIPVRIEYYKSIPGAAFQYADTPSFIITDNPNLTTAIKEILNANNPEPWKGAGWDRLKVHYADTTLNINTNEHKIGFSSSGTFYDLNDKNFITDRLK